MAKKPGLGRGLAALLGESTGSVVNLEPENGASGGAAASAGVIDLPVNAIRRNPRQPRRAFDAATLDELATSISAVGVVQPVIVRQVDDGYELIAGERRWRAAQKAGFTAVPAIVRTASDVESLELALVENVVRQQLNPVDEAFALRVLLEDLGVTQESLAARVGKSRSAIANKIRLLDLPSAVQDLLTSGSLSEGHGRALLGLSERGRQLQLARRIVEKGLSVRQVEEEVRRLAEGPRAAKERSHASLAQDTVDEVRDSMFSLLGVAPRIKIRGIGGVIEVPFKDEEELERLARRLRP
ncbi:MAG: ParB/RepB/Spo0J family partition protein [Thermoleophilia bacterium]|nr:ParB/RepB/Spo0J family partition protein [Thermoleophilia bacterium]